VSTGHRVPREGFTAGFVRAWNAAGALKASSTIRVELSVRFLQMDLGKFSHVQFWRLTIRLSDAGLRRRPTKLIYPHCPFPPWLTEGATPRSLEPIVRRRIGR
jgi:hypothetical protein